MIKLSLLRFSMLAVVTLYGYSGLGTSLANSFDGQVTRALFTSKLKNEKPVNEVLILENNIKKLYFYSEVEGMKGKTLSHTWEHHGEKLYRKEFSITKDKQVLISSYKLSPGRTGEWLVLINDEKGMPLKAEMFKYVKKGSFAGRGIIPFK